MEPPEDMPPTYAELGIGKKDAAQWQDIAEHEAEIRAGRVELSLRNDNLSFNHHATKERRTEMKRNGKYISAIKKGFGFLKNEVRDYNPETFDHLEKRFNELYFNTHRFRLYAKEDIKAGKCPAKEWLKAHTYPVTKFEAEFLTFCQTLTEDSQRKFLDLMTRYFFMIKNSEAFEKRCKRLNEQGFNSYVIWLERYKFEPVFKQEALG